MSQKITVRQDDMPIYDILLEDSFAVLPKAMEFLDVSSRRVCLVTDSNVAPHYLSELEGIFEQAAAQVISFVFPAGESHKNLDTVRNLYTALIEAEFDRHDLLVALGGGVVGDLTGFAAATYLRGIDFIQIPTTLLSQVDSSIGGKTGVDFDSYKNMVGAFKQPRLVYMNLSALNTLPEREYLSGMGEIVKHGMIKDRDYLRWLMEHTEGILSRDYPTLEYMISVSCRIKRDVVEKDPKEQGERALLNFGHTLGHAAERLLDFRLLHGECVAAGCLAAGWISAKRGLIRPEELEECQELMRTLKLPVSLPAGLRISDVIETTHHDKKMRSGVIRFILLKSLGEACIVSDVTEKEMREALKYIGLERE